MNAQLVSYRDGKRDVAFPLVDTGTLIGRDAGCFVQLTNSRISKRHAVIKKEGGHWVVEDLGSRNGIRVNGERVTKTTLSDNDKIAFGPLEFEFVMQEFADERIATGHVIDLSSRAAEQTLVRKPPDAPKRS